MGSRSKESKLTNLKETTSLTIKRLKSRCSCCRYPRTMKTTKELIAGRSSTKTSGRNNLVKDFSSEKEQSHQPEKKVPKFQIQTLNLEVHFSTISAGALRI